MTELPTTFGKYFLTEKLATGGMAEIYLAKLVGPGGFEKQLVIKQIHPKLSGQRHFVDLFVAEAKTLVTLAHGNIVPVYELGVIGETYFIAMEYIDGPTLYRLTERVNQRDERIAPATAAWIAARILEGLDYAHRKGDGVIHRDLSPRNVMLSRDGEVKLVDFGIAVTLGGGSDGGEAAQSAPTGSFPYMSPEQVRRDPLTQQSDLFSAGVLLWEMLVGQRLFARADADATLAAVATSVIARPSTHVAEIPAKLEDLVMRALERDTATRWATSGEMLAALQRYLYGLDDPPTPRDVAALVARFCPPETRRLPTNVEIVAPAGDGDGGPHTAVIPRAPAPQRTFATHLHLIDLMAGPPVTKVADVEDAPEPATQVQAPAALPARTDRPPDGYVSTLAFRSLPVPGREPPSRGSLIVAGIGAVALAVAAIAMFYRGRNAVLAEDAGVTDALVARDARATDAAAPDAAANDANAPDAAIGDAAVDAETRIAIPPGRDARPAVDAATAEIRSPATAILKIGADPWGEITVDGIARGRTPAELTVPVGHHVVEIVFRGEDPPRKKISSIDVVANETLPLQADFTKP